MALFSIRDPSGIWRLLQERLERRLPLDDLTFKDATGSYKNVRQLNLQAVVEPVERRPIVAALLFRCEDTDAFRRQRVLIDQFLSDSTTAKQSWIVIQVSLGGSQSEQAFGSVSARSLTMRARPSQRAFERLEGEFGWSQRADVGGDCALLELFETAEDADNKQWTLLMKKIRRAVSWTAEHRSADYEARLRRMMKSVQEGTTSYASYFLLKERYSNFYAMLRLHEEALRQLDELDAMQTYMETSISRSTSESIKVLESFLDISPPDFHAIVLENKVGVLDYHQYLFTQQTRLLIALHRPDEIAARALPFIRNYEKISESHSISSLELTTSWILVGCFSIVERCMGELNHVNVQETLGISRISTMRSHCANLMLLALDRVEKFGIQRKFLQLDVSTIAFSALQQESLIIESDSSTSVLPSATLDDVSTVCAAFTSIDSFNELLNSLSNSVEQLVRDAGRTRFATRIVQRRALAQYRRGRLKLALTLFMEANDAYDDTTWTSVRLPALLMIARCRFKLGDFIEFIDATLELLQLPINQAHHIVAVRHFRDALIQCTHNDSFAILSKSLSSIFHSCVCSPANTHRDERQRLSECDVFCGDSLDLRITFVHRLSCVLPIDEFVLVLRNDDNNEIKAIGHNVLKQAHDDDDDDDDESILLHNVSTTVCGVYRLKSVTAKVGHLHFHTSFDECGASCIVVAERHALTRVMVSATNECAVLGRLHPVCVCIQTLAEHIINVSIKCSHDADTQYAVSNATNVAVSLLHADNSQTMHYAQIHNDTITLPNCSANSTMSFFLFIVPPTSYTHTMKDIISTTTFEMMYEDKLNDETMISLRTMTHCCTHFACPLYVTTSLSSVSPHTFAQALLHCSTMVPITLIRHTLDSDICVLHTMNEVQTTLNTLPVIQYEHPFSLVFQTTLQDGDELCAQQQQVYGTLHIHCRPHPTPLQLSCSGTSCITSLVDDVHCEWRIPLRNERKLSSSSSYDIVVVMPVCVVLGDMVSITISLSSTPWCVTPSSSHTTTLCYEIEIEPQHWMISGPCQARIVLENNAAIIHANVVALTCGYLHVPRVRLWELHNDTSQRRVVVDDERMNWNFIVGRRVLVYPPNGACVSTMSLTNSNTAVSHSVNKKHT